MDELLAAIQQYMGRMQDPRTRIADYLQQKFDPNYTNMQSQLYNMRNKNKKSYLDGQPLIGSDTQGQTIPQMMYGSPRWEDLAYEGADKDRQLGFQLRHPDTPDSMNKLMMDEQKHNMLLQAQFLRMRGGV